ncbi:MAG TPA: hypothetical protein VIJ15_00820, partial [Dermatophilaceae bacterium]
SLAGKVIAPATALSALLFYFGYVSSRSQYEYFGLDVDTIGLTTQDFIMRSPQPLLVPLLVLSVLGAGAVLVHSTIRHRLASAYAQPEPGPVISAREWIRRAAVGGLSVMATGFVLLLLYPVFRDWPWFNLVTPLVIALGGSIAAYAIGASRFAEKLESASASESGSRKGLLAPAVSVFIVIAVAASIFWATATFAQFSGVGLARSQALRLDELPSVILDTRERLFLTSPGLGEVALPPSAGQTFHYRYRHLRLLIQGNDRMFLVPDRWSPSDSTLMVRLDPGVRMQFQFTNQAP